MPGPGGRAPRLPAQLRAELQDIRRRLIPEPAAPPTSGPVSDPAGAVDGNFAAFDGVTGSLLKDSGNSAASFDAAGAAGAVQTNLTTHQGLTASVHGFDASGNAPAQTHDNSRHTTPFAVVSDIAVDTNLSTNMQRVLKFTRNLLSTGLISGGILSINVDPTKFDLTAGTAVFVNSHTDPENPTLTYLTWPAKTAQTAPYRLTATWETVGIDSTGTLVFKADDIFNETERRDYTVIGALAHEDNTDITAAISEPHWVPDLAARLEDFFINFGPFNVDGNEYSAASTNLTVKRSAGATFSSNINYTVNRKTPSILSSSAVDPIDIWYSFRDGLGGWDNTLALVTDIDPNYYDDGSGTLAAVPAGKWTIQTLSLYALYDSNDFQYGQVVYDNQAEALSALQDAVELNPYNEWDTFRGWLVVKQGATDLSDPAQAAFRAAGKLGLISMMSSGAGGEVNTASNVGTAGVGFYDAKVGIDLQFRNLEAASTKVSVTNYPTNKSVRVDVAETNIVHQNLSGAGTNTHAQIDTAVSDSVAHIAAAAPHTGHVQVGGQLGGTAASPDVRGLRETAGPTLLTLGAWADGQYLMRSGATAIGGTPGGGPGGLTLSTTEVNLGSYPRYAGKFSITGVGLTSGRPVLIQQANGPYTGKGTLADEAEMDGLTVRGKTTSTTSIDCYWNSATAVRGNFKFDYVVG